MSYLAKQDLTSIAHHQQKIIDLLPNNPIPPFAHKTHRRSSTRPGPLTFPGTVLLFFLFPVLRGVPAAAPSFYPSYAPRIQYAPATACPCSPGSAHRRFVLLLHPPRGGLPSGFIVPANISGCAAPICQPRWRPNLFSKCVRKRPRAGIGMQRRGRRSSGRRAVMRAVRPSVTAARALHIH